MNREIKFRAWQKEAKGLRKQKMVKFETIRKSWNLYEFLNPEKFDRILMQFTGLHDKNGKEIYEGDILAYESESNFKKVLKYHFPVKWENYGNGMCGWTQFSPIDKFVVCGNIYENPELL